MSPLVQVPFMSSNERFYQTPNLRVPGPGTYEPKKIANSMNSIEKIARNFGVNAERFGSFEEKEV